MAKRKQPNTPRELESSLTRSTDRTRADDRSESATAGRHDRERIASRAYELYLARGGDHGRDQDDWLEAERELGSRPDSRRDE